MKPTTGFADLHCHPHMRSFNYFHDPKLAEIDSVHNPWHIIVSKKKAESKGRRAAAYSQCDLAKIKNGNMRLVFASLYPLERGWVSGRKNYKVEPEFKLKAILNMLTTPLYYFIGNDRGGRFAFRDILQSVFMKIPRKRVNYVQSKNYNYFEELKQEKVYLDKANNRQSSSELFILPFINKLFYNKKRLKNKEKKRFEATGTYVLAESGKHVEEILDEKKIAVVLTIEGANVFNTEEHIHAIKRNIDIVKAWKEPLFFITFSHHFNNFLAGHARSIPDIGNKILDQSDGLHVGFNKKGYEVARYLLAIDEDGNDKPEFGRRILIDVKHLCAAARRDFYETIVLPSLNKTNPIPIVASHVAYSGRKSLIELIDGADFEKSNNYTKRYGHKFNNWNINLCDEDVVIIFKSKGLIGINLDQRVLGVSKEDKNESTMHASYIWQNIRAMMLAVLNSDEIEDEDKKSIVNLFCLGTDFDGFIDPLNSYPTVLQFRDLRKDLIREVEEDPSVNELLNGCTSEEFVNKICIQNAYDFVRNNFKESQQL